MTVGYEFRESLRIAWDALRAHKMRSALTTLGIVIGIVTVTLMGTAIQGLNEAFHKSIAGIGADVLYIQRFSWFSGSREWWRSRNRRELTMQHARELTRLSATALAVAAEAQGSGTVQYGTRSASGVWVVGNTEDSAVVRGLTLVNGRWFSASDVSSGRAVCVIGQELVKRFFPLEDPVGKRLRLADQNYEVIGVIDKMGQFFTGMNFDNQIVIPITRFTMDFSRWPDLALMVKVRDVKQIEDAKEELRGIMRKVRRLAPGDEDDFAINQQDQFVQVFNRVGGVMASAGLFVTGLSLFVGGIGIMNIMFVSVAERTREIGVRKAIGAKRRTILLQFLTEAAMITGLAGLLGVLLSWPLTLAMNQFLAARMSIGIAAIALLVSVLTGVVAGFLPAWRAARMNPVDALRSE